MDAGTPLGTEEKEMNHQLSRKEQETLEWVESVPCACDADSGFLPCWHSRAHTLALVVRRTIEEREDYREGARIEAREGDIARASLAKANLRIKELERMFEMCHEAMLRDPDLPNRTVLEIVLTALCKDPNCKNVCHSIPVR